MANISLVDDVILGCIRNGDSFDFSAHRFDIDELKLQLSLHQFRPQLYRLVKDNNKIPEELLAWLEKSNNYFFYYNLSFLGEILRVNRVFREAGIDLINYKGLLLSQRTLGDPLARESCDIDLVVDLSKVKESIELLSGLGYKANTDLKFLFNSVYIKYTSEENLYNAEKNINIDLHWRLFHPFYGFDVDLSHCFANSMEVICSGAPYTVLEPELEIVLLMIHRAKNRVKKACHLLDLKLLLEKEGYSWGKIYYWASYFGAEKIFSEVLHCIRSLSKVEFPEEGWKVKIDSPIAILNVNSKSVSANEKDILHDFRVLGHNLGNHGHFRGKVKVLYRALGPCKLDFEFILLPTSLSFLYPFVKAFRLLILRPIQRLLSKY